MKNLKIMEVCGTHTAVIRKSGLQQILPENITLVSGPGCPVCVTPKGFIDRLIAAADEDYSVVTFADMLRVPGNKSSLAKANRKKIFPVYSPFEVLVLAKEFPKRKFLVAAVGFETTTPIFAVLLEKIIKENIENIKFCTALKTMPNAMKLLQNDVDGFICPGHVSVITGTEIFEDIQKPCVVAGFTPEYVLMSIKSIVRQVELGEQRVENLYKSAVSGNPQTKTKELVEKYFTAGDAVFRGLGDVKSAGMYLKSEFERYDYGSKNIFEDEEKDCKCSQILTGKIQPENCPLFMKACTPESPVGACMVSGEGACNCAARFLESV